MIALPKHRVSSHDLRDHPLSDFVKASLFSKPPSCLGNNYSVKTKKASALLQAWDTVAKDLSKEAYRKLGAVMANIPNQSFSCASNLLTFLGLQTFSEEEKLNFAKDYQRATYPSDTHLTFRNPERAQEIIHALQESPSPQVRNQIAIEMGKSGHIHDSTPQKTWRTALAYFTHPQPLTPAHEYRQKIQQILPYTFPFPSDEYALQEQIEQALELKKTFLYIPGIGDYVFSTHTLLPISLSPFEYKTIADYIQHFRDQYKAEATKQKRSIYLSTRETHLPRSIHFTPEGKVFIHFTRINAKHDTLLGEGSFKKVVEAFDFDQRIYYASASLRNIANAQAEIEGYRNAQGLAHFIQLHDVLWYIGNRGTNKCRLLLQKASSTVDEVFATLPFAEKTRIALQLIQAVAMLHKKGFLHRDLKPANLLLQQQENLSFSLFIGDLGACCHQEDEQNKQINSCTPQYASPEYLAAVKEKNPLAISACTTQKLDAFSVGIILQELFSVEEQALPITKHDSLTTANIITYLTDPIPERRHTLITLEHFLFDL